MKKIIAIFLFLLTYTFCFSQEKSTVNAYVDYFNLPRETLFLHTNKTTFLPGEEVWFKAYAYDRKSQLTSKATTNIRVGIFNKDGKQVDQKLFLAKDGFANGNIKIDSSFVSGDYYLKASTNWMKNFKEDDAFVTKIKVLNPESEERKLSVQTKEYDIQFLPEGGHLLAGVKNNVGVKALDDTGKGTQASGIIVDDNGREVAKFKSNFMGLGRFSFVPLERATYKAIVTLSNTKELKLDFPKVEAKGINIQVNNLSPRDVVITLSTNSSTFDEVLDNGKYTLLIHKDGVTKVIPMEFTTAQEKIIMAKSDLFKGVNIVTLLDHKQQPILERMFFNEAPMKNHRVTLQRTETVEDSLSYNFITGTSDNSILHASVSVLPKGTKSYNPRHNILSAFYLKPYLKGHIENPAYYFTNTDRKKRYELDVLLLTQGWSRYDWNDVFYRPPVMNHTFNNGLTVRGNMNDNAATIKKLILFPTAMNKSRNIKFDQDGKFEIQNFMPQKDEYLAFTALTDKDRTKKPGLAVTFPAPFEKKSIDVSGYQNFQSFYSNKNSALEGFVSTNRKILDEVVIKAKRDKEKRREYRLKTSGKLHNVTPDMNRRYINLAQFLENNGFDTNPITARIGLTTSTNSALNTSPPSSDGSDSNSDNSASGAPSQGGPSDIESTAVRGSVVRHLNPSRNPVVFFLNNVQINEPAIVLGRPLFEFEDIYIDATLNANIISIGGDVSTFATVIKLFTRRTPFIFNDARPANENAVRVTYGFEATKTFYSPKYGGFDTELFQDLGAIHWTPNFVLKNNEITTLKTLDTGLNEVTFYIEGISSNGDLISQAIMLENSKKQ